MIALMRQLILCLTAASLFGAVALSLTPNGALKEVVRLGVGLMLILSLVIPLRRVLPERLLSAHLPQHEIPAQQDAADVYRQAVREQVEAQAAQYVVTCAAQNGLSCTAQTSADIGEDGVVSITAVSVRLREKAEAGAADALRRQISAELGISADAVLVE